MKSSEFITEHQQQLEENLHQWFKEKWVRFGPDGKIRGDCARGSESEGKPKCLPQAKAHALGKKGRASAAARKRREDPNPDRHGAAINVPTKKPVKESHDTYPNCVKNEGVAEGLEQINEYRNRLLQYVKSLLPTWPDYVLKDWLVPNKGNFSNLPADALKNSVMEKLKGQGLSPNTKWQLVPNMKFTMDMFEPMTKERLIGRAGGHSDMGLDVPRDKERHATQATLAQQEGGVRKEPVLLIKTAQGYELLEGWHRTIQHFAKYPNGYTGPAYVAVAQGLQGVAEEKCPHCGGAMYPEHMMMEKKDACYYKVKASAKVWPSAYASGRLVQCRKKGAANYGNKS